MGNQSIQDFGRRLRERGLLFDGAMGTLLEAARDTLPRFDCAEQLVLSHEAVIADIHRQYLEAGADVVETCTFGATPHKLSLHGLDSRTREINVRAARLARQAAGVFPGALVAGSMGPSGLLSITRRTDYDDFFRNFHAQAAALLEGGVDILQLETCNDLLETRAGIHACRAAMREAGLDVPVAVSFSVDDSGRILLGTTIEAAALTVDHLGVDLIGINCSSGPDGLLPAARRLAAVVSAPMLAMPNRGLPEIRAGRAEYPLPEQEFAEKTSRFLALGFRAVGGCCGTTPACIRRLRETLDRQAPGEAGPTAPRRPALTGIFDAMLLDRVEKPILVGERLNYHGSRKFRQAVDAQDLDTVLAIARQQLDRGAAVLDLGLATRETSRQLELIRQVVPPVSVNAACPLMVDTTELEAMEEACRRVYGRGILNSCNLEDPARCRAVLDLARRHGQMIVCLPVSGDGVPQEPGERVSAALRIRALAEEEGLSAQDLIFDTLVLTLATGRAEDRDNGRRALDTLAAYRERLPGSFTLMGVSNVSYGLPGFFRPVLNNVLLHHARLGGLDFAIFNPLELKTREEIGEPLWTLAEDLLLNRRADALDRILALNQPAEPAHPAREPGGPVRPLPDRLRSLIVDHRREGFLELLDQLAADIPPQSIIEQVFLPAMAEIGRLMEAQRLPLPYVLESAAMTQDGLNHLRRRFTFSEGPGRGRIVLATVKGDVHDIGKNLVKMLLVHNGYAVDDLGANTPAESIVEAARSTGADIIGLSALLVSTSREMKQVVDQLRLAGSDIPVLIGGAVVNHNYAVELARGTGDVYAGGVFYGRDAFQGLKLAGELLDPERRRELQADLRTECQAIPAAPAPVAAVGAPAIAPAAERPYLEPAVRSLCVDVVRLLAQFNFEKQCGRKFLVKGEMEPDFYRHLLQTGEALLRTLHDRTLVAPTAVTGVFPVDSTESGLIIRHEGAAYPISLAGSCFERLIREDGRPILPLMVVTLGGKLNELVKQRFDEGDYLQGYILSTIGAELADELAEVVTRITLDEMGLARAGMVRYSPGYPIWPALADQPVVLGLLGAGPRIGVQLSEGFQMIPEFSVSGGLLYKSTCVDRRYR